MTSPRRVTLRPFPGDDYDVVIRVTLPGGRVVFDGVCTDGDDTISSETAKFVPGDIGKPFCCPGKIAVGTTIVAVAGDGKSATLSAAATADATGGGIFIIRNADLSGYTFTVPLLKTAVASIVELDFTVDSTFAAGGEVTASLTDSQVAGMPRTSWFKFVADIGATTSTWASGPVIVGVDSEGGSTSLQLELRGESVQIISSHIVPAGKGPKGDPGDKGDTGDRGLTWREDWSNATSYLANDGVRYNGESYIALSSNQGKAPASFPAVWGILAEKGADGATGPQGPQGIPGTGSGGTGNTNLGYTASSRILTSDTGSDVTLPLANDTDPGLLTAAHYTYLNSGLPDALAAIGSGDSILWHGAADTPYPGANSDRYVTNIDTLSAAAIYLLPDTTLGIADKQAISVGDVTGSVTVSAPIIIQVQGSDTMPGGDYFVDQGTLLTSGNASREFVADVPNQRWLIQTPYIEPTVSTAMDSVPASGAVNTFVTDQIGLLPLVVEGVRIGIDTDVDGNIVVGRSYTRHAWNAPSDGPYQILITDEYVGQTGNLTTYGASVHTTLPDLSLVPDAWDIEISDESRTASPTTPIAVIAFSGNTINGGTTFGGLNFIGLDDAGTTLRLRRAGTTTWQVISGGVSASTGSSGGGDPLALRDNYF